MNLLINFPLECLEETLDCFLNWRLTSSPTVMLYHGLKVCFVHYHKFIGCYCRFQKLKYFDKIIQILDFTLTHLHDIWYFTFVIISLVVIWDIYSLCLESSILPTLYVSGSSTLHRQTMSTSLWLLTEQRIASDQTQGQVSALRHLWAEITPHGWHLF